jgi:hypothetical protein
MIQSDIKIGFGGGWNYSPNRAWAGSINNQIVEEIGSEDCEPGRGHSWRHYLL